VIRAAIKVLLAEGWMNPSDGPRNATLLTSVRPYRQANDPTSSHLVPPRPDFVPDEVDPPRPTSSPPLQGDEVRDEDEVDREPTPFE
jgi:hypothetical protein